MQQFEYDIVKQIAVISENSNQSKEINMISWNGKMPVYDIRTWGKTKDGKVPYKGITLTTDEWEQLCDTIFQYTALMAK